MPGQHVIHAEPSKGFFIDMLTRDITLLECVLDLVDNAIHSVIVSQNLDVMRTIMRKGRPQRVRARIDITFDREHFRITDTCGGISSRDAEDEVFRLGKPATQTRHRGLGVYGIGMKRAFFKIGDQIAVESRTRTEKFAVDINVPDWQSEPENWTFEYRPPGPVQKSTPAALAGTTIKITELHKTSKSHFGADTFAADLLQRIGTTYALFIRHGIRITVNGRDATQDLPSFATSGKLGVTRQVFRHDDVDILLLLGLSPEDDRTPRGWYVFCNGRMVLEAERTSLTGWGNGTQWNPKYNHFLGWVLLGSKNVDALPWRTTKHGVVSESAVYQVALAEMRTLARPVLKFLAEMYPGEVTAAPPQRSVLQDAQARSILDVARQGETLFTVKVPSLSKAARTTIQYDRPVVDIKRIATSLEKPRLSARKVGEFTFDYYLKNVVDE